MVSKTSFDKLKKIAPRKRVKMAQQPEGASLLAALTPTQYAELFPKYYQKSLPDVSGFRAAISQKTQKQQADFQKTVADQLGIDPETGRRKGGWMEKMGKDYAPGGRLAPGGKDYMKPLSPIEKTIKEKTGIDITAGPNQADLKGDAKKLFEDLKAGRVPLDDPRAAAFKKMSPKDFAGSGLQIEDVDGKQYVKMAPVAVTEEQIKEKMTSGGNLKQMIDAAAKKNGIDPRIMYGIVRGESGHESIYDHNPGTKDKPEDSWGPFQMNKMGGLGNDFQRGTGLDVKDSKTLQAQTDWIAKEIAKRGGADAAKKWVASQWYGYGSNVGGPKEIGARAAGGDSNWNSSWKSMGTTGRQASSPEEARRIIEEEQYQKRGQDFAAGTIEPPQGLSGKALEEFKNMPPGEQQRFSDAFYKMGGGKEANKKINEAVEKGVPTAEVMKPGEEKISDVPVGKIRSVPIKQTLRDQLNYAAAQTGVNVEIVSGGQMSLEQAKKLGAVQRGKEWYLDGKAIRTGSTRHDEGGAADVKLYKVVNGEKVYLDMRNDSDRRTLSAFTTSAVKAGATGVGAGMEYMGASTIHIGGGTSTTWGSADWIKEAHYKGTNESKNFNLDEWKNQNKKIASTDVVTELTEQQKKDQISDKGAKMPSEKKGFLTGYKEAIFDGTATVSKPAEKKSEGPKSFDLNRSALINSIRQTDEFKSQAGFFASAVPDDTILNGFFADKRTQKIMKDTGTTYDPATGKITSKNPDVLLKSFGDMDTSNILKSTSDKTATIGEKLQREFGVASAQAGEMTPEIRAAIKEQHEKGMKSNLVDYQNSKTGQALGMSNQEYTAFRKAITGIESGGGDWKNMKYNIRGGSSNRFSGAYQMGSDEIKNVAKRLGEEAPVMKMGRKTVANEKFLNDPHMQERYFDEYMLSHHESLMRRNKKYANMSPEQQRHALAISHNAGPGGASRWIDTGNTTKDKFNTDPKDYGKALNQQFAELKAQQEQQTQVAAAQQTTAPEQPKSFTERVQSAAGQVVGTPTSTATETKSAPTVSKPPEGPEFPKSKPTETPTPPSRPAELKPAVGGPTGEASTKSFLQSQGIGVPSKADGGEVNVKGQVSAYPINGLRGDNTLAVDTKTQQPLFTFNPQTEAVMPNGQGNRADVVPTNKVAQGPLTPNQHNPVMTQLDALRTEMGNAFANIGQQPAAPQQQQKAPTPNNPDPNFINKLLHQGQTPFDNPTFHRAMKRTSAQQETDDLHGHWGSGTHGM